METMSFELSVEGAAADAEHPGGNRLIAPHLLQGPDDVLAFDFYERDGSGRASGAASSTDSRIAPLIRHIQQLHERYQ